MPLHHAVRLWGLRDPVFVGHGGNLVYRCDDRFLRLTPPAGYRTLADNEAECRFVRHLDAAGVQVCPPIPSCHGNDVEAVGGLWASVFPAADGRVLPRSAWSPEVGLAWGEALARIHAASVAYPEVRWHWPEECWFAESSALLDDDSAVQDERDAVFEVVGSWPRSERTYGMGHGDFGPQNFGYHPERGVTAFDFGNACHHFYSRDLVVSELTASSVDGLPEAVRAGYARVRELPEGLDDQRPWLVRLRRLTIYLSRLWRHRDDPSKAALLDRLRADVVGGPSPA